MKASVLVLLTLPSVFLSGTETAPDRARSEEANWQRQIAKSGLGEALWEAERLRWDGKPGDFEAALKKLSPLSTLPALRVLTAEADLRDCRRPEQRLALLRKLLPEMEKLVGSEHPVPEMRRPAALACLRWHLELACVPGATGRELLKRAPWSPAFRGLPMLDGKLDAAAGRDAKALFALADELVKSCSGSQQIEAAQLAGDCLMLIGQPDKAAEAYSFALGQSAHFNSSTSGDKISGALLALIQTRQGEMRRLEEIRRLSLEFILWRDAEAQRLGGRLPQAIEGYDKLLDWCRRQQEAVTLAAKKEEEERHRRDPGASSSKPEEAKESPFAAAAGFHRCECLLRMAQSRKEKAAAEKEAGAFLKSQPLGLYRGRLHLLLAESALRHLELGVARKHIANLSAWLPQADAVMKDEHFDKLLPGVMAAAGEKLQGPLQEWLQDAKGRVRPATLIPGQMLNELNSPWLRLDLEDWAARYEGFFLFCEGHYDQALTQWQRMVKLDANCRAGDLDVDPNDFTRLQAACQIKRMLAFPEEARLFSGDDASAVLLAEFWYATQRFGDAEGLIRRLLAGEAGRMTEPQNDYLWSLLARVQSMSGKDQEAMGSLFKVLEKDRDSFTERRVTVEIANLALGRHHGSVAEQQRALSLLEKFCGGSKHDEPARIGHLLLANLLYCQKKPDEAAKLLSWYREEDGGFNQLAQAMIKNGGMPE